jgi:hypothetical protein
MFAHPFLPEQFLRSVYGTEPFVDYCRQRGISFEHEMGLPLSEDGLERWMSALAELSREEHAGVELDLAKVHELAGREATAHLLQAAEPEHLPPAGVPDGAPVALWFLLHRPDFFHEVFLRHESREGACWRTARVQEELALRDVDARARALENELRAFFRRGGAETPSCAVESRRLAGAYCFTAQVSDRLQFYQVFTDEGRVATHRARPALTVAFAYYPKSGTVLLESPLRPGDRAEELLRRLSQAVLGVLPFAGENPYDLDPLKGPFRPLPDSDDMESVRLKALHLHYPASAGRRRLELETLSSDGPFAIEQMLRAHSPDGVIKDLRVTHAELQIRLRVGGGTRDHVIRLWPDRSNLGPTSLGDRFRTCLSRWGLAHARQQ